MAPRPVADGADTDASMSDAVEHRQADYMVRSSSTCIHFPYLCVHMADLWPQEVDETPDYTDSDTNPNTTASSVVGEPTADGRKRRTEANQLRRSIFGKKHDQLGLSKVS